MKYLLKNCKSQHHRLSVIEHNRIRTLLSGDGIAQEQSAINIDDLRYNVYDYSLLAMYSFGFIGMPKRSLVVGLGGAVVPREIVHYFPESEVDVLEIDKEMINVATKYFFLPSHNINLCLGDAYKTIKLQSDKRYDFIFLDAFSSDYIPFSLMTTNFAFNVMNLMSEKCVIAINMSPIHSSFNSHLNTLRAVFESDYNIYRMVGQRNNNAHAYYITKGKLSEYKLDLPSKYYSYRMPEKVEYSDGVLSSSIFSL